MKMWISHPECINIVRQSWNNQVTGFPMYVLSQKLKILKEAFKVWNKNTFGNVHTQVTDVYKDLDEIQMKINNTGIFDLLMDQEKAAQINLENALNVGEMFWHEKSKVKWHSEGDRNTTFFHRVAKIRNVSSHITTMRSGDITLDDPKLISAHVVNHFTNMSTINTNVSQNGLIEEVIPYLITDRMNNML